MCMPVIRALLGAGKDVRVLALTTSGEYLARHGIESVGFRHLVSPGDEQALAWGEELAEGNTHPQVPMEETRAYLGLSFAELVAEHGLEGARLRFAERGRACFEPVGILRRAIRRWTPQLVVATSSPRAERAAIIAAGEHGIPSACLVDLFAHEEIKYVGQPGYATRLCVLDESVRARFIASGRRPDEVVVTGNPAFDGLADPALAEAGRHWLALQPWRHQWKVLWLSQPEPAAHRVSGQPGDPALPRRIFESLRAAVGAHPGWHLIVRPHPSEDPGLFASGGNVSISSQDQPLHPVLHAVDAVVCMTSTAGYEAALLGKPLVYLPLSVYRSEADYSQMGLALACERLEDLEKALNSIALGRWQPAVRLSPAGGATAAVHEVLEGLMQGNGAGAGGQAPTRKA